MTPDQQRAIEEYRESRAAAERANPIPNISPAPVERMPGWGVLSTAFCAIGGLVCIFGGVSLVGLKAASDNSLIEALTHGIGIYCIGKGLFMIAASLNFRGAIKVLWR